MSVVVVVVVYSLPLHSTEKTDIAARNIFYNKKYRHILDLLVTILDSHGLMGQREALVDHKHKCLNAI